jgi:hypothetical protein
MVGAENEGSGTPDVEFLKSELWGCDNPASVVILCRLPASGKEQLGGKKYPWGRAKWFIIRLKRDFG